MLRGLFKKILTKISITALVSILVILFFLPLIVQAQNLTLESISGPFGSTSLIGFIAGLIRIFLSIIGVVLLVVIMYAGFNWTLAEGDPAKINKAKKIITGALIGLTLIVSAFAITSFLTSIFKFDGSGEGGSNSGCEPGSISDCSIGVYCSGVKTCSSSGVWGGCVKYDDGCGSNGDYDDDGIIISSNDPVITYISPAKDVDNNNPAYGFLGKKADDDIANGASGNYITISGRHFGNAIGEVIFKSNIDNTTTTAPLAKCVNSWRSNQIIVEVPHGLNVSNIDYENISSTTIVNYQVAVITAETSATTKTPAIPSKTSNYKGFLVNNIIRPGICSANPLSGSYPTTTTIEGNNFPLSGIQNVVWSMRYFDFTSSVWEKEDVTSTANNWTISSTIEILPENKIGRTSFRIYNGSEFSNYYAFLLSPGRLNDPCGYDSNACNEDNDTCKIVGLECQFCQKTSSTLPYYKPDCNPAKNCTCQQPKVDSCDDGMEQACLIGGCVGKQICIDGQFSACVTNTDCIPYLGISSTSTLAIFTWPFIARKNPTPGMSCSSALWSDGTCDLNGCISKDLFCKIEGSDRGFIEIYNNSTKNIDGKLCSDSGCQDIMVVAKNFYIKNLENTKDKNFIVERFLEKQITKGNIFATTTPGGNLSILKKYVWSVAMSADGKTQTVVTSDGLIYASLDSGETWQSQTDRLKNLKSVAMSADGKTQTVVTSDGLIYASLDSGETWQSQKISEKDLKSVAMSADGKTQTVVTSDGLIYASLDSGKNWQSQKISEKDLKSVAMSADGKTQTVVTSDGLIYASLDSGETWIKLTQIKTFTDIDISSDGQIIIVSDRSGYIYTHHLSTYTITSTTSAFYPHSFGRVVGESQNNFVYFSSSTPGSFNENNVIDETNLSDKLIINEVSLSSDPCTCVQRGGCKPGDVDHKTCPKISNCNYIKTCDINGYFGACIKSDPNCIEYYPAQVTSTLSIFTWAFLASVIPPSNSFQVVVDCSRSSRCLDSDMLPSPTPWPNEWSSSTHPELAIRDELACVNSVISARFTTPISDPTLNSSTLKIFMQSGINWVPISITDNQIEKFSSIGEGGADTFQISNFKFETNANYRILISNAVLSETGVNLIRNNKVVEEEKCETTNNDVMSSSTVAFCWNIKIRDSDKPCPVGCINCSPKNYFNRYFGQKRKHLASPISEDNVCLMLQQSNYNWDWYEQHQDNNGWIPGDEGTAYSVLLNMNNEETNIYRQQSETSVSGKATTTAKKESGWRMVDVINYFKEILSGITSSEEIDLHFFKITAKEVASNHFGSCPAHNDFSSPVVIESQYCTNDEDHTKRILQSPSPWKGQQDACTNAVVFVLFNRNMVNETLTKIDNIIIQKCDPGKATSTNINACRDVVTSDWQRNVFSYSHPDLSLEELESAVIDEDTSKPDGVRLIPPTGFSFAANAWYRVIIKGGNEGVRGAIINSGKEISDGTLITPTIPGTSYFNNGRDDYFWYFKTGSVKCPIERVAVLPQLKFLNYVGLTQIYNADPQAANCNHLNPTEYTWSWSSLMSLNDETEATDCRTQTGNVIATICDENRENCNNTSQSGSYVSKVFSKKEGEVKIKARAENTRLGNNTSCLDDKYGYGNLQIGRKGFKIINYNNADCFNSDIYFNFSSPGNGTTITYGDLISDKSRNVGFYECDGEYCDKMTYKSFKIIKPEQSGTTSSNPYLATNVILKPDNDLSPSKYYRVIVRGGISGVKSYSYSNLEGLNYSINPNNGGEVCDPSVYPWRTNDPDNGMCTPNCKFNPFSNLCGTLSQECVSTTPYCNEFCQKTGNSNFASCGNGIVELGEDCDDGNINNGDGCSSNCLWEGSNGRTSRCNNGKIEYGEQCDFGNPTKNSKNKCDSNKCLWISGYHEKVKNTVCNAEESGCNNDHLHIGSSSSAPICGNGKIEIGEQCDDGLNNGSDKRCSTICLLNGSATTCNNNNLENGQYDSFSWIFKLSDSAEFCEDSIIKVNPCFNGIWRFEASPQVSSYTVKIYKGQSNSSNGCINNSDITFGKRIWNNLINTVRRIFALQPVVAANYWCPISNEVYNLSNLSAMERGNYKRNFNIQINNQDVLTEAIAYTNEKGFRVINYIPSSYFSPNSEYFFVTTYKTVNDIRGTSTAKITTYEDICKIRDIDIEVWPTGLIKQTDAFFCYSDPESNKLDECGRYTDSPYDDDMSASWTKDHGKYDLREDGSTSGSSLYKKGNQHLYRYWALGDVSGRNGRWLLQADFESKVFNLNARTMVDDFSNTSYSGDSWVTAGANPGKTILNLTATSNEADSASASFSIITYFCNNPWPDARNFPFLDDSNNCNVGSSTCHNTNFGTYYCRDAGIAKICVIGNNKGKSCNSNNDCGGIENSCQIFVDDDLPSISKYNALTGKLEGGISTLSGDKVKEFLFGRVGDLTQGSRYDFSATSSFISSLSTTTAGEDYQTKFHSSVDGSVYNVNNAVFAFKVNISKPGKYYLLTETSNHEPNKTELGIIPPNVNLKSNATSSLIIQNNACNIIDGAIYHNVGFYFDNQWLATTSILASAPSARQVTKIDQPITIDRPGDYTIKLKWDNNCNGYIFMNGTSTYFNSNFRIYKISLINMDEADTLDAIGIRVYSNDKHYAPSEWYLDRFKSSLSGNKMIVDGYEAVSEGRTVYVGGGDLGNYSSPSSSQSIFSNIYLMSFSQGASQALQNIFKQMVNNWFFNSGNRDSGGLEYFEALGYCEGENSDSNNYCLTDIDCLKRGKTNCNAYKAKLIRDIKRLADLRSVDLQLNKFYNTPRCSENFEKFCNINTPSDCFGQGKCGGYYPILNAGTYVIGKTFSTWPSWQNELGKTLSITMPTDPINKFINCVWPYDPTTCWDQNAKKMQSGISTSSSVYIYYYTNSSSTKYELMSKEEFSKVGNLKWSPEFEDKFNPFKNYERVLNGNY